MWLLRDKFLIAMFIFGLLGAILIIQVHGDVRLYQRKVAIKRKQFGELKQLIARYRAKASSVNVNRKKKDMFILLSRVVSSAKLDAFLDNIIPAEGGYLIHFKGLTYRKLVCFLKVILVNYSYVWVKSATIRRRQMGKGLDVTLLVVGGD